MIRVWVNYTLCVRVCAPWPPKELNLRDLNAFCKATELAVDKGFLKLTISDSKSSVPSIHHVGWVNVYFLNHISPDQSNSSLPSLSIIRQNMVFTIQSGEDIVWPTHYAWNNILRLPWLFYNYNITLIAFEATMSTNRTNHLSFSPVVRTGTENRSYNKLVGLYVEKDSNAILSWSPTTGPKQISVQSLWTDWCSDVCIRKMNLILETESINN